MTKAKTIRSDERVQIRLTINGIEFLPYVEPRYTLVDVIRGDCGLTGTHVGCEHGICGACTVIIDDQPARACLIFAVQADGKRIRTVEGLANDRRLSPLQLAFQQHHALQCGFCTPGFLMLATSMLETNPDIGEAEMLDVLSSNLCRCTGYKNIVAAVRAERDRLRAERTGVGLGESDDRP